MRRFSTTEQGRVRWRVNGKATTRLEALMADPDRVLQGAASVARRGVGRKHLFRVEGHAGEPALFVKVFPRPRGVMALGYLLRPSKAQHEATIARRVAERGFDAAQALAVGEERRFGLLQRSFSVVPEISARDLRAILTDPATEHKRCLALVEAFASLLRRLHDLGIDQDDPLPNNFLVTDEQSLVLIDFERCHVGRPLGARRWRLLAKLHRDDLGVTWADRLRFLRSYLGPDAGRGGRRAAWVRIRSALRKVRAKAARHAARGALRSGRRVARDGQGWVMRGREEAPVLRLTLGPQAARDVWIRTHQLERLRLPALRPVRLGADWVELEHPGETVRPDSGAALIHQAKRRFQGYGEFVTEGEWALTPDGAKLIDPRAFRLEL